MNKAQLAAMIRFHLGEMGARNAQFEFEHLARHLARAKVYSNLLPATGPVGAGGDQGRDFETYRSSAGGPVKAITDELSSGERRVVFACTLQAKVAPKIKADVTTIVAGARADEIVYFCEANVPVAKRRELIAWAAEQHHVELQIFDGTALAEMLAEADVFWIAEEYLHLPADIFPENADESGWYGAHYERWRTRTAHWASVSDFFEVKAGLRHATFDREGRPHLRRWLDLMETFLDSAAQRRINRSAAYEIAVATLRGKEDFTPSLPLVRDYFSDVEDWLFPADLSDAATLVTYAFAACLLGHCEGDPAEALEWRRRIAAVLGQEIESAHGPGRLSALLRIRGQLAVVPKDLDSPPDHETGFSDWNKALDAAERAPLFPIEEFARHLGKLAPWLSGDPRYAELVERVEVLVAIKAGPAAAADLAFDRALESYRADELVSAVRDLHRIQQRWFTGDRLGDFQRATLLLSQSYRELGLAYAAKYPALVGAHLALHDDHEEVKLRLPHMLLQLADAELAAGNSLAYTDMLLNAVGANVAFAPDPLDQERYPEIFEHLGQLAALRGTAARFDRRHLRLLDGRLSAWDEQLRAVIIGISEDPQGFWTKGSEDEFWREFEDSVLGRPFADVGPRRIIEWRALGIRWVAEFTNDAETVGAAEELVAQLQIAQVVLLAADFLLVPTTVRLNLELSADAQSVEIETIEAAIDGISVKVLLAAAFEADGPDAAVRGAVELIAALCRALSALPDEKLLEEMAKVAEALMTRIFMGRPYRELYPDAVPPTSRLPPPEDVPPLAATRPFTKREHPLLRQPADPAWNYDEADALEAVRERYERAPRSIRHTLPRLLGSDRRTIIEAWHREGLRDWEILSILANAAMNIRAPLESDTEPDAEQMQRMRAMLEVEENPGEALDPAQFTDELLEACRRTFLFSYAMGQGLILDMARGDCTAVERLLIERYGLRSLDVAHDDLLDLDQQ